VNDGSNPLFDGRTTPKFGLQKGGVHSGHVQMELQIAFVASREVTKEDVRMDTLRKSPVQKQPTFVLLRRLNRTWISIALWTGSFSKVS